MRRLQQTAALALLAAVVLPAPAASPTMGPATAPMPSRNAAGMQPVRQIVPMPPSLNIQTLKICAGTIPLGWIKVGDEWNPTTCGSPSRETPNQWTLARYETQLVGATLRACYGPVPSGWTVVSVEWDPNTCGKPGVPTNNVMTLQRVN